MGSGQGRCVARYGVFDPGLGQDAGINDVVLASCVEAKPRASVDPGARDFAKTLRPSLSLAVLGASRFE